MTVFVLLFLITLFVAYANGANDNFKGVATLYGANVADYRTAITLATIATFLGCVASVFFAEALIKAFSGKGLVPDALAASPIFLLAVGTGAGATLQSRAWPQQMVRRQAGKLRVRGTGPFCARRGVHWAGA
jgi:PiT family inorganic phosphate transporter